MSSLNTVSLHGAINMGGATGTSDYAELENKPKINNVELIGNKTTSDLGINEMPTSDGAAVGSILTHTANGDAWTPPLIQVEANPIGATVGDLSTIEIQGLNYKIPSGGGLNYSTDEQVVGTWYDSKPIYQKTFLTNLTLGGNSWTQTGLSIQNFGSIVKCEIVRNNGDSNGFIIGGVDVDVANGQFDIFNLRSISINITSITIWYTKTTDTI